MVIDMNLGDDLESTATSASERRISGLIDILEGTVNSLDLRKRK